MRQGTAVPTIKPRRRKKAEKPTRRKAHLDISPNIRSDLGRKTITKFRLRDLSHEVVCQSKLPLPPPRGGNGNLCGCVTISAAATTTRRTRGGTGGRRGTICRSSRFSRRPRGRAPPLPPPPHRASRSGCSTKTGTGCVELTLPCRLNRRRLWSKGTSILMQ